MTQPTPTPVKVISLPAECAYAGLGAFVTGVGSFSATLTVTSATTGKALEAAGIAAAIAGLTFFGNSLRNWLTARGFAS